MNKRLGKAMAHTCFWAGDAVSKINNLTPFVSLYRPYNWLMIKSSDLDEIYGAGIWEPVKPAPQRRDG